MLLDNEDKISVSVQCLMSAFLSVERFLIPHLLSSRHSQIDRVVEELRDRPELLHVVS